MKRMLLLGAFAVFAIPASAHEGEDHSASVQAPSPAAEARLRAATATELFELVAVPMNGRLVLYLDRFETNEPVSGARLDVESDALKAVAVEVEPGVYQVVAEELTQPGPHALTIDVRAGDDVDLLSLAVGGAPASETDGRASVPTAQAWRRPVVWGASGAVLLAGAGVVALRRRGGATNAGDAR